MNHKIKVTGLLLVILVSSTYNVSANKKPFSITIRGGSGTISKTNLTADQDYRDKLTQAI